HHDAVSGGVQQCPKLPFGRFHRRVGHIVDETYIEAVRVRFTELDARLPGGGFRSCRPHMIKWLLTFRDDGQLASSAWSRSAMMSSTCSMPTLSRIISGFTPAFSCSSTDICRWVVEAGWQANDFASPMLTSRLISPSAS